MNLWIFDLSKLKNLSFLLNLFVKLLKIKLLNIIKKLLFRRVNERNLSG